MLLNIFAMIDTQILRPWPLQSSAASKFILQRTPQPVEEIIFFQIIIIIAYQENGDPLSAFEVRSNVFK